MKNLLRLLIVSLALSCIITSTGWAKESKPKSKEKPFTLTETTDKLPSNYSGDDIRKLVSTLSAIRKAKEKGDFETTEEYQKRVKGIFPRVDMNRIYAFNDSPIEITYDADRQLLTLIDGQFSSPITDDNGKFTTLMKFDTSNVGSYIATNAFGAKIKVKSSIHKRYEIAYDEPNVDGLSGEGYLYKFVEHIALPVKEAQSLRGKIGILKICKLDEYSLYFPIEIKDEYEKPTFTLPYETYSQTFTIPVKLLGIWVYNTQTGEIYVKKNATVAAQLANPQPDEQKTETQ